FPQFGFGYGQAGLNFYAPLSYWPGTLAATLGITPPIAAELTVAFGFLLGALAAYGFGRYLWGSAGGLLAAVAYTYFPYHLADAYQRGAFPELMAFIWLPLILWATTAAFREPQTTGPWLWHALAWAGLIYTHNLTALLAGGMWVVYLLIMTVWTRRLRRLIDGFGSLALGLGLSAPLWLPFFVERSYVGLALGASTGYRNHLATLSSMVLDAWFHRYRLATGADHPLSWLTVAVCLAASGLLVWRLIQQRALSAWPVAGFGIILATASAFMITQAALPVWRVLEPILMPLQYPWRFLVLTAVGVMLCIGALPALLGISEHRSQQRAPETQHAPETLLRSAGLAALGLALILQPLPHLPAEPLPMSAAEAWSPDRMWREDAEVGQVGATWTGEFLPLAVQEQRWALGRPREVAQDGARLAQPQVKLESLGYDRATLTVTTAEAFILSLHQFYLPMWQARINGEKALVFPRAEMGLLSVQVPAGTHQVVFRFGPTLAWIAATLLALLSSAIMSIIAWRTRSVGRVLQMCTTGLLIILLVLTLNCLGLGQKRWTPQPLQTTVGDAALLIGYDITRARGVNALDVTLYWFALRDIGQNYKTFVHLLGPDGQVAAQHDGDPVGGFTPTSRWRQGELIHDRHRLLLPSGLVTGPVRLKAGMYQLEPLANLPLDPPTEDGRIDLGEVSLK
ncbi:MAG: 6-pyruvoyl-tetrahydropterin synthase-related protein, partial [Anaerolineae bacterium]